MTTLLDQAVEAARALPPANQDDIARLVLRLAGENDGLEQLASSADERTAIVASKDAAARGEFATEEQVRDVWAKYGL